MAGGEPDRSELEIALPTAREDANYTVTPSQLSGDFAYAMKVKDLTAEGFTLSLSNLAPTGVRFAFVIAESTGETAPGNVAPTAAFSAAVDDLDVTFSDESTDEDGEIVSWEWDFGDGQTSTSQHPEHTYTEEGTYTVILTVTDDDGATDEFEDDITVTAPEAAPAPTIVGAGTFVSATSAGALSAAWPAGHQAGDVMILAIPGVYGTGNNYAPAVGTEVENSPQTTSGNALNARLHVFWARAESSSESNVSIPDVTGDDAKGAQIIVLRGCAAEGSPIEATAGNVISTAAASTEITIPGLDTTTPNCRILAFVSHTIDAAGEQVSSWANASLSDFQQIVDNGSTSGGGVGFAMASGVKASAGTVSATTATLANADSQARLCVAVKP